jgi:hypothetical protein
MLGHMNIILSVDILTKQPFTFEVYNVTEFSKIKQTDVRDCGQVYVEDTQHGDQQALCDSRVL